MDGITIIKQITKTKMYKLPKELRDNLITYFTSLPMKDVEQVVNDLRRLQPIEEATKTKPAPKKK